MPYFKHEPEIGFARANIAFSNHSLTLSRLDIDAPIFKLWVARL